LLFESNTIPKLEWQPSWSLRFTVSDIAAGSRQLRALSFSEVEEARRFEGALRLRVKELVLVGGKEVAV